MDNTVRVAMQPVTERLDIIREAADQSGNTARAEAFRESINIIRDGIQSYEYAFMEDLEEQVRVAYGNSFSSWLVIDDIQSYIQEKIEEAKDDAVDSVMYNLEAEHSWTEEMQDEYRDMVASSVEDMIRDECMSEGGFDI